MDKYTKSKLNLLAFDLGASNGRAILGSFDGERMVMETIHRFENSIISLGGQIYWNTLAQYQNIKDALAIFGKRGIGKLDCLGIDSFGVDYGLLDKNGNLLSNVRSYRGASDEHMAETHKILSPKEIFFRTGIAPHSFNTIYQLHTRVREKDSVLDIADTLLFTPDLLGYFLTGEKQSEYTISTTSALLKTDGSWDSKSIQKLGIPENIFTNIQKSGNLRGRLLPEIAAETGINVAKLAAVGCHDTASAVAAIPGDGSFAFCSSGTWSLLGIEKDEPDLSKEAFDGGVSSEGTVQGGFRLLMNIIGFWIIQECRREWIAQGKCISWDSIDTLVSMAEPFRSIIDSNSSEFYAPGSMVKRIQNYCMKTKQLIPETIGQIARCVYESMALQYRKAILILERSKGEKLTSLNITGGGVHNDSLNQMIACATGIPVVTGPAEGAALGNLLMQAICIGEIKDIPQAREVVKCSVETKQYHPEDSEPWLEAELRLEKFRKIYNQ